MARRQLQWIAAIALLLPLQLFALGPSRVGEHVEQSLGSPHPYPKLGGAEAQLVWTDTISFEGATYIAPHFSRFQLAPGDYVVVRSEDGSQRWTYRGLGRAGLGLEGGFYSTRIHGEVAVVELWSQGTETAFGYTVDHFGRGYNNDELIAMWDAGLGELLNLVRPVESTEAVCTTDDKENAICYETSEPEIYEHSRPVARLFITGTWLCTGWLVGDQGHLITNEHCITSQTDAGNTDYEWMAEAANCGDTCPQLGCDGVVEADAATLIQDSVPLDYALVLPDTSTVSGTDLAATYGYMLLRSSGAVTDERIYVPQHPSGRGKEIAVFSSYSADTTGFATVFGLSEPVCDASSMTPEVGYFADTEGGSSGSPVLGYSDHLVVSLHHCRGSAYCDTDNPDIDDPNRGLPIEAVIADLGPNLPAHATADIFDDGFESGDTTRWSGVSP